MKKNFYDLPCVPKPKPTNGSWKFGLSILFLFCGLWSNAAAPIWNGNAGDNNWATASNWSTSAVPVANDDVTITIGSSITITNVPVSLTLNTLTFTASSGTPTLTLSGVSGAIGTLTITGNLTINSNITVNDGGFTFAVGGNLAGSGTVVTNTSFATGRIRLTTAAGGKTIAAGLTLGNLELLNTSGTNTAQGAFTVSDNLTVTSGGTFSDGGFTVTVGGNIFNLGTSGSASLAGGGGAGKISMTGTSTISGVTSVTVSGSQGAGYGNSLTNAAVVFTAPNTTGGVAATGIATTNSSGNVTAIMITNPGSGYTSTPTVSTINGVSASGNGTFTVNRSTGTNKVILAAGTSTSSPSTTIVFGNLDLNTNANTTIGTITIGQVNGELKFTNTNTTGKLVLSQTCRLVIGSGAAYNSSQAKITTNSSSNSMSALVSQSAAITINSTGDIGTLYFDQTTQNVTNKFSSFTLTLGTVAIGSYCIFNSAPVIGSASKSTTLNINANMFFSNNGMTLNGVPTINLAPNVTVLLANSAYTCNNTGGGFNASAVGAGLTFCNTTGQISIPAAFFGNSSVYNFTDSLNTAGNAGVTLNSAISVTNFRMVNGSTHSSGNTLTLTNGSNLSIANGGSITIQKSGTGAFAYTVPTYGTSVSVIYSGSSPIVTGSELPTPASGKLANLTINNSGGVTLNAATTISSGNTLFLTSGVLTNTNNITMANGSTISRAAGTLSAVPVYGTSVNDRVNVTITATCTQANESKGTTGKIGRLTVNGGGTAATYTLNAATSIDSLTLTNSADVLNCATFVLSGNTSNTINSNNVNTGLGTVQTQCLTATNTTPLPATGTGGWGGTVNYNATSGAQTVVAGTYNNLTLGNTSGTQSAGGNVVVNGTLTNGAGTFALGTNTLTGTLTSISNTGTISTTSATNPPIPANKVWPGTINYSGGVAQSLPAGTFTTLNVTVASTAVSLTGNVSIGNSLTFSNSATLVVGANTLSLGGTVSTGGNINATNAGATVVYNGSSAQSIAANTYTNTGSIAQLTINNTAGVTLNTPITVTGTLTLTAGQLITTANNIVTVTNTANSAVTGFTNTTSSGYVNGPLAWTMPTSGSGDYVFPVGTSSKYHRLVLNSPTTSVAGTVNTVQVVTTVTGGTADGTTVSALSATEYWQITPSVGDITGGNISLYRTGTLNGSFDGIGYSSVLAGSGYSSIGGNASASNDSVVVSNSIPTVSSGNTAYFVLATKFTFNPIISSFSGRASGANVFLGDTITITGNNFVNTGLSVAFNGTAAPYINWVSNSSVQALVPAGTKSGTFTVTSGGVVSAGFGFTVAGFVSLDNGDWATGATWLGGAVPTNNYSVTVNHNVTVSTSVGSYGDSASVTINSGKTLSFGASGSLVVNNTLTNNGTIDMTNGGTLTLGNAAAFANPGTFTAGTGTVTTNGSLSITNTTPSFYNLNLNGALTLPGSPTINNSLNFNSTSASISQAPIYVGEATLQYNAAKTVGNEWGAGTTVGSVLMNSSVGGGAAATSAGGTGNGNGLTNPSVIFSSTSGSGASATATMGSLGYIAVTSGGSGYTTIPTVTITGGGGSGARATALVSGGAVTGVFIQSVGSGYTSVPTIQVVGNGTGAVLTGYLGVTSVAVNAPGSGYTSMPTVNIATFVTNTAYSLGQQIISGGYVHTVTTAGTTASSAPSFATTVGNTTSSNTVVFTNVGQTGTAPTATAFGAVGTGVPKNIVINANVTGSSANRVVNGNMTIGSSATFTASSGIAIMGTLSIGSGSTFNIGSNSFFAGPSFANTGAGVIIAQPGTTTPFPIARTWSSTGTFRYNGTTAFSLVVPGTYNNLDLDASTGISRNIDAGSGYGGGTFNINGTLTWSGSSSLGFNQTTFNFGPNASFVITNGTGTATFYNLSFSSTTPPTITGGSWTVGNTFTPQSGTTLTAPVVFTVGTGGGIGGFTGAQTIPAINYNNITISGTRTSNVILSNSGTIGIAGAFTYSPTFSSGALNTNNSTISYNGSGSQTLPAGLTSYDNLVIGGARSGSPTITLPAATVAIGTSLNVNYTGSASFTTASSTLNLNGSTNSISSPFAYNILTLASSSTLAINAATTGNGATTVPNGATLSLGAAFTNTGGTTLSGILQMNGGSISAAPTYTSTGQLQYVNTATVGNEWTAGSTVGTGVPQTIVFNAGAGKTVTTPAASARTVVGNLTISSGSLSLGNDLTVFGNWSNSGTFVHNSKTVTFGGTNGTASTITKTSGETFFGLTVNNTSGISLGSVITVNGTLTLTNGLVATNSNTMTIKYNSASSSTGSNASYVDGPLTMDLNGSSSSGTYYFPVGSGTSGTNTILAFAIVNPNITGSTTATVQAIGSGNNTTNVDGGLAAVSGEYWSFSNTGTLNSFKVALVSANVAPQSVVAVNTGSTFTSLAGSGVSGTVTSANTATDGPQTFAIGTLNVFSLGSVIPSGPVVTGQSSFTGYVGQVLTINGSAFTNSTTVTINGASVTPTYVSGTQLTAVVPSSATALGNIVVTDGSNTDNNSFTVLGYISAANGDWNTASTWVGTSVPPTTSTVTVNHAVTVASTVSNLPATITVNATKSLSFTGGTLSATSSWVNNGTITMASGGTLNIGGSFTNGGTFTVGTGTVNYNRSNGGQTILPLTYNNLTLGNASGTQSAGGAITVNGILTTTSGGTFDVTTNNYALNLKGNLVNNGTLNTRSDTVTFSGTTTITQAAATTFNSVNITGALTAPAGTINVAGSWTNTNTGTFTANGGTVNLSGGSQTLSGATTFFNLTKTTNTAATLTLPGSTTQTITGTLTLTGLASPNLLTIASSSGTATINPTAATVNLCSLSNITNSNTTAVTANNSVNGGGLTNINTSISWVTGGTNNFGTNGNWSTNLVPGTNDNIVIDNTSGSTPIYVALDANRTVANVSTLGDVYFAYTSQTTNATGLTVSSPNVTLSASNPAIAMNQNVAVLSGTAGSGSVTTALVTVSGISGTSLTLSTNVLNKSTGATTLVFGNTFTFTANNLTVNNGTLVFCTGQVTFNTSIVFNNSSKTTSIRYAALNNTNQFRFGSSVSNPFSISNSSATAFFDGNKNAVFKANNPATSTITAFFNPSTSIYGLQLSSSSGTLKLGSNLSTASVALSFTGTTANPPTLLLGDNSTLTLLATNTSTLSTTAASAGGGSIDASNTTSAVVISGNHTTIVGGATGYLFNDTKTINSFTFNRASTTFVPYQPLTVQNLFLTNGTYNNSGTGKNITIPDNGAITIDQGALSSTAPVYSGKVSITYTNSSATAYTTGSEIPVSSTAIKDLTINASGTSKTVILGSDVTVNGTLTINASNTLDMATRALTLGSILSVPATVSNAGTFKTANTTSTPFTGAYTWGGTVQLYATTTAQTVPEGTYNNLDVSGGTTGGRTFTSGKTYTIKGTYTAATGTGSLTVAGSTIVFQGTAAQTMPVTSYHHVTIDNTNGVTLAGNTTLAGSLAFTNGLLNVGNNALTASSFSGASSSKYVVLGTSGSATATVASNASLSFPIGTATSYVPLNITNRGGASNSFTTAVQSTITNAPTNPNKVVNMQWSVLAAAATTADIVFQFNNADKASQYTTGANELGIYTTTTSYAVSSVTATGSNPYTVSKTGIAIPTSGNNLFVIGNVNAVELPYTNWTGTVSTDWNLGANWDNNVPSASQDATVNAIARQPVISNVTNAATKSLTIGSGATVTNNGTLSVRSTFTNNGTIAGSGTTTIDGTSAQQLNGTGTVGSLTINNTAGATVSSSGKLNVTGVLTLQSGQLTTNNNLVFKSNSLSASGLLAPVGTGGNTGTISGTAMVERYIPNGYRAYRDIAAGVANAGSVFNNWQEGGASTSGNGIFVTGATSSNASDGIDANGLDKSVNSVPSLYIYQTWNGTPWFNVSNTKNTNLSPFIGYRALIRGDRSFSLFTTPVHIAGPGLYLMMNATRLRATGSLVTGNVVYSTTGVTHSSFSDAGIKLSTSATGYASVANPYVCPIDWNSIVNNGRASGLSANYYFLDPTVGVSGAYVSYNASTGASNGNDNLRYIQAGQAIFVENTGTAPVLTITEADKWTAAVKTSVFGSAEKKNKIAVSLKKDMGDAYRVMDIASVVFDPAYANSYGKEDARKLTNPSHNLSIVTEGRQLAIDGRKPATDGETIALNMADLSEGHYQLYIDLTAYKGYEAYLVDAGTNTETQLIGQNGTAHFTVTNANTASLANRFSIRFKAPRSIVAQTEAPAVANSVKAFGTQGKIKIVSTTELNNAKVLVYGADGKMVSTGNMNGTTFTVSAASAAYIVKVINGNETQSFKVAVE